jgi:hypothetical protein
MKIYDSGHGSYSKDMLTRIFVISFVLWFLVGGCEQPQQKAVMQNVDAAKQLEAFGPQTLDVVGLSELKPGSDDQGTAKLTLFVRALDSFGSAVKTPCIIRVELYEYVARSPSPRGKRVEIWPDFDLTDPCKNNAQWRDYLRAYEFNLDVNSKLAAGHVYIVEVTCLSALGKRLSIQHNLSYNK